MSHHKDDAWVRLEDVPASLGDFLDSVGREPLTIKMSHATWQVTRSGEDYYARCFGAGGGWYNDRELSRRELRLYVEAQDTVQLKRPESQRPEADR